jgi:hypothetical protein
MGVDVFNEWDRNQLKKYSPDGSELKQVKIVLTRWKGDGGSNLLPLEKVADLKLSKVDRLASAESTTSTASTVASAGTVSPPPDLPIASLAPQSVTASATSKETTASAASSGFIKEAGKKKRTRCRKCQYCLRQKCGSCHFCINPQMKKGCVERVCQIFRADV